MAQKSRAKRLGWIITNEALTLPQMTESRGKKVLKSLLPECQNTMA